MKKLLILVLLVMPMSLGSVCLSSADIINGDFSSGLTGWTTLGDVTAPSGEAILGDNGVTYSLLYQAVALDPGLYFIDFDFRNQLSGNVPDFTFPDTFFASLYISFANDLNAFDLASPGSQALGLFDMDYNGVFNINVNGTVAGSSTKGVGWSHFNGTFDNTSAYAIPTFELFDLNFIDNDSQVLIDNVSIAPVPEPGTLLLLGSGLAGLIGMGRKKFKKIQG